MTIPRILTIAGSDSGGGAGIQADIKTITALGGYAASALTALTAQNTQGVAAIHPVPPAFLRQQIELVLEDIGADAIKIGMVADAELIHAVAASLAPVAGKIPIVLDPVMVAATGARLLADNALAALKEKLLPLASVITPNEAETGLLAGMEVKTLATQKEAARRLANAGVRAVLATGGEGEGDTLTDILVWDKDKVRHYTSAKIITRSTHGTGCTLSAALAFFLAQGAALPDAVEKARGFVRAAMLAAPGFGKGFSPLHHPAGATACR